LARRPLARAKARKCEPKLVHPSSLNQRFEFGSMDAGADVLQNAARLKRLLSANVATSIFIAILRRDEQDKINIQVRRLDAAF
jgi:hypothetical protein